MNTYVILLENKEKPLHEEIIQAHVNHLRRLSFEGHLQLCGPFTDYPGGMIVITADDALAAHKIAQADPFVSGGYRDYTLRTLEVADNSNNFLL